MATWRINELIDAIRVIQTVATSPEVKKDFGVRQREQTLARYRKTGELRGYRVDWMRNGYAKFLRFLVEMSRDFDRTYPHDHFSRADQVELVYYWLTRLQAEKKNEEG